MFKGLIMKYAFLFVLLFSCTKKPEEVPKEEFYNATPVHVVEEPKQPDNVLRVNGCYRNVSQENDHFIRIEKKYDEKTFKATVIENLEYSEKIATYYDADYFEYNCEAFSDMKAIATPYKKPSESCIQTALKECTSND